MVENDRRAEALEVWLVDSGRVVDAGTDEVASDIVPLVALLVGVIDDSGVLGIDEAVALLDPEADVVLVLFDKVTSPAPSC
jgi:hypothetical protein